MSATMEKKKPRFRMLGKDPYSIPLDKFDVSEEELYETDTIFGFFERMRKEDPVHYCKESRYGPYWSVTKFKDIMEVESYPEIYSPVGIAEFDRAVLVRLC